jgi:3,4-dihydroxy 2-butanone 4-phosphate synthase / GTP cyclohydrolase II
LKDLGVKSIRLLTNNPDKIGQLQKWGIDISEQIPLEIQAQQYNKEYLLTKKIKMGHLLHQDL